MTIYFSFFLYFINVNNKMVARAIEFIFFMSLSRGKISLFNITCVYLIEGLNACRHNLCQ